MMPRCNDIEIAWHALIQQEPNGRKSGLNILLVAISERA